MADAVFVNVYIEKLMQAVTELTKTNILLQTQVAFTESINIGLSEQITTLQAQLDKYQRADEKKTKRKLDAQAQMVPADITLDTSVHTD